MRYTRKQIEQAVACLATIPGPHGKPLYTKVWYDPWTSYWKIFMQNEEGTAVSQFLRDTSEKLWMYDECAFQDITATDLRDILQDFGGFTAFKVYIWMEAEHAEGIYSATLGRMGIAHGADASFADIRYKKSVEKSIEEGIEMYFNDSEEWEKRN